MTGNKSLPAICIVGRPNVGKSSLFNCLIGEKKAVTLEQDGTTRDRIEGIMRTGAFSVRLFDTGGFYLGDSDEISVQVKDRILNAIETSDSVIMVVDAIRGITGGDEEVAELLRKSGKPVKLVANKSDNDKIALSSAEFYSLGLGDPEPVSCLHRRGIRKLKSGLLEHLKSSGGESAPFLEGDGIKIAVVGRPNVGKSSFVNRLLSKEHAIVSSVPGTTRDSTDTFFSFAGDDYVLIDTAGIRHKRKVKEVVDSFSMMRSHDAIKRSDVTVLMLDASDGVTNDDLSILDAIEESGKGCLLAVNKWDLADNAEESISEQEYRSALDSISPRLRKFPKIFVSCLNGHNVSACMSVLKALNGGLDLKVPTSLLNRIFKEDDPSNTPISKKIKRPSFKYIVQSGTRPLEFKYFVNDPSCVVAAHESFIENRLRESLPLEGIPVKLKFVRSSDRSSAKRS